MRDSLKKILLNLLTGLSRRIVKKYNPKVIAITGSYGKTSSREAIYAILNDELSENIRMTEGELNGEWGMHISVIGAHNPSGSIIRWIGIAIKGVMLLLVKRTYPDILLLEMAADHPGDIEYLVSIAPPDIAVLTGIGRTHLEFFGSVQEVAKEKFKLVTALKPGGVVVYNADDEFLKQFIPTTSVRSIRYGLASGANVSASQLNLELNDLPDEVLTADSDQHIGGIGFKVTSGAQDHQAYLANMIGRSHVYAALAGISVAIQFDVPIERSIALLKNFKQAPGRLRLLRGVKHTNIIDDSYNSSPDAAEASLEALSDLSIQGKKWAVMGEMLELGDEKESLHRQVGKRIAELGIDYLITVGDPAHFIAHGARDAGMDPDHVFEFDAKDDAGKFLQDRIEQGDLILIKASRGVHQETNGTRFEKIVKEIMAEPLRADELLVHTE